MQEAAMKKTGGYQPPVLAAGNVGCIFGAHID